MTYQLGHAKMGGRVAGVPNKRTIEIREVLHDAARQIGGIERLVQWIREAPENERLFWSQMWMRLCPVKVEGTGDRGEIELRARIAPGDLERRLEERGLPGAYFGEDRPVLELECNGNVNGNGNANGVNANGVNPKRDDE
jgi:hypothetical protein